MDLVRQVSPHAEPILVICLTAILGLLIGSIRIRGIKLGVAGMLFSGLLMGHLGLSLDPHLLSFLKEFGLALFVFTVGLQLGPGFFSSLKKEGLKLNALALFIVLSGGLIVFAGGSMILGWDAGPLAGIFSGATTNTPSLGAVQQIMAGAPEHAEASGHAAMAYAVAYPFGVVGIILVILLLKTGFRIDTRVELARLKEELNRGIRTPQRATIRVENPNLDGVPVRNLPGVGDDGMIISRIRRNGRSEVDIIRPETLLHLGDLILAIGTTEQLERATLGIGQRVDEDLRKAPGNVIARRIVVTDKAIIGKTIAGTRIREKYGVTVSRVSRQDMILTALPDLKLQLGDMLNLVGEAAEIDRAAAVLGNSVQQLNVTSFASIFIGITVGILVGLYPWHLPGMPVPLRLGLAGGPLIIAILMGRLGRIGPLVVHMPLNANTAFRELGIIFFLACVGLDAGGKIIATAFSATGLQWMALGVAVTTAPLLAAGYIGRRWMKLNYITLTGLLAGSMTDPPALAFANKLGDSDYPALAYANVYPLTMLMRILVAQVAVLMLFS